MGLDGLGGIGSVLGGSGSGGGLASVAGEGGGLTSLFGSGGDPIASIIDEVGGALGLPKELTGLAKIGAAIYTGDVMCGVSGGMDLMQGAARDSQNGQAPATTECPGSDACDGYASDPSGTPGDRDATSVGDEAFTDDEIDDAKESNEPTTKRSDDKSTSGSGMDVKTMIAQGMDVEDIVQAVLSKCLDKMDQDIEKQSAAISKESNKASGQGKAGSSSVAGASDGEREVSGAKGPKSSSGAPGPSLQEMQTKLQDLAQKRQQLFSLMTNISSDFNETSKQILANLGKA